MAGTYRTLQGDWWDLIALRTLGSEYYMDIFMDANPDHIEVTRFPAYGNFYITSNDPRARDIHGGGSGLPNPYADYQGWIPTYGCLRMQNADGVELSQMMIDSGNNVTLTVVE